MSGEDMGARSPGVELHETISTIARLARWRSNLFADDPAFSNKFALRPISGIKSRSEDIFLLVSTNTPGLTRPYLTF